MGQLSLAQSVCADGPGAARTDAGKAATSATAVVDIIANSWRRAAVSHRTQKYSS